MTMNSNVPNARTFRSRGSRQLEFRVYFALIFLLALPSSTVSWVLDIRRRRSLNLRGPLARAWAEADRITPVIFSA
jgi:hypothetical protein